jgi:hypothetical protein
LICSFCPWPGGEIEQYQIHRFNARPVYILFRKPLGGNIYKQCVLGVMVIRLGIEIWEIDKGGTKELHVKGWVDGRRDMGDVVFCGPCVYLGVFQL